MQVPASTSTANIPAPRLRREWLLPLIITLAAGVIWLWFKLSTQLTLEDAYITFRYARNLARGDGFVFNVGEHVLGTTTPLQTLLLAGLGRLFGPENIPLLAALVMPWFGLVAGLFMYAALRRFGVGRPGAAAGLILFYTHPLVIRTSVGGMETPLVLFLMALSFYLLSRARAVAATAVGAVLVLCRIDGLIWAGLIGLTALLAQYRRPVRQAAFFVGLLLPWMLFAWRYFGSIIPNTMRAKGVVRPGREDLLTQPQHLHRVLGWLTVGTGFAREHPLFFIWIALLAVGSYAVIRLRRRELLLLPVFPVIYAVAMFFGRAPVYQWYLIPMLLTCLFLGGLGVGQLISWVAAKRLWPRRMIAAAGIAAMLPGLWALSIELPKTVQYQRRFQENEWGLRERIGTWIARHTPPTATVAMEAVGYQGYFSERRVIDLAGLITPRTIAFKANTGLNGEVFRRICTELKPDYLILRSFEVDENHHFNGGPLFPTEADRTAFFANYHELRRFAAPYAQMDARIWRLTLYERNPTVSSFPATIAAGT